MSEIDEVLAEEGLSKPNLEASLTLGRLVAAESGLCCHDLGLFVWECYLKLEGE